MEPLLRPASEGDLSFIYDTWKESYRCYSADGKSMPARVFYKGQTRVIKELLARSTATIACSPESITTIFGYLVHEQTVAHYAFVKGHFQKMGIASKLFKNAFGDTTVEYSHKTFNMAKINRTKPQLIYNPYLLRGINGES